MLTECITWVLDNFGFAMFMLAVVFIVLHKLINRRIPESEAIFRWMALFALGFTGIYAFVVHAFYPTLGAMTIGWPSSPFQTEVAMANLGFGVLGILSFKASYPFRLATVIGSTCWLWGDAGLHTYEMIMQHNFSIGNAGSWYTLDVILPLILISALIKIKLSKS